MPNRQIVRAAVAALFVVAFLAADQTAASAAPSTLRVTAVEDVMGLSSRLVFSTAHAQATGARSATLTNTGSSTIHVTDVTIGGQNASQFKLATGQDKTFSIAPGASKTVGARFTPIGSGNRFATLNVHSDATTPNYEIRLRGVSARGTLGSTEPQLAQLMQLFGYTTNVGFSTIDQATTRAPVGDEVISPYFVRASASQPVQMFPLARYTGANTANGDTGRTPENSGARQSLYRFPPDQFVDPNPDPPDESIYAENQKTFPQIATGSFTFTPTGVFGIYGLFNYSDDQFNEDESGVTFHNVRVYPAKGEGGVVLPNTWIVGVDVNTNPPDKNFDYQDQVILLRNARPALTPGPAAVLLPFSTPVAGTVPDKDGQGTGFTSIQPNKNGTQSKPNLIDLTGGHLRITSTAGKNTGLENLQVNALQAGFDGSRSDKTAQARLLGPMSDLTAGFQQKALYWGPDQDNYLKIEIEHRTDKNGVFITVLREQSHQTATIGQVRVSNPAAVSTLDLRIVGDLENGLLTARYNINGGTWKTLGSAYRPPAVMRFFSPQARAGVLVSNTGTTRTITGTYDSFSVS